VKTEPQEETKALEPVRKVKDKYYKFERPSLIVKEGSSVPDSIPTKTIPDVEAAIALIKDGTIQFAGAYHENRRKQCIKDLGKRLGIRNAR